MKIKFWESIKKDETRGRNHNHYWYSMSGVRQDKIKLFLVRSYRVIEEIIFFLITLGNNCAK